MPVHQKEETKNEVQARNMNGRVTSTHPPPRQELGIRTNKFTLCKINLTIDDTQWFFKTGKENALLLGK